MNKIGIIGANSYIARNMIYVLEESSKEYDIALYDLAEAHIDGLPNYEQVNILSRESVKKVDFTCDILFIFSGKTGTVNGFEEYDTFIDINEHGLLNILHEYVEQRSKGKIIFPSTRLVYKGNTGALKETAEKEFNTIYAVNKFVCEQYLEMYRKTFDVKYCIFRISVPYGTLIESASSYGTAEFMLNKAQNKENITLFGDGTLRRTLVHMEDLCNILIAGAEETRCTNDVFNVGGEDYSLAEMARLIADKYHVDIDYVEWPELARKIESGDTVFDDSKLISCGVVGPRHSFVEWVMEKGE